jgi:hypothetical protein
MKKHFWKDYGFLELSLVAVFTVFFAGLYFHDSTQGTYQLIDYRQGTYYKALALQFEKGLLGSPDLIGGDWLHYKGMYYLYFGPFPAFLWLLLKNIGIATSFTALTLFASVLNLVLFYIVLAKISKQIIVNKLNLLWFRLVAFILYGFGPLYFIATRYFIYETAIVMGSTLLLLVVLAILPYWIGEKQTVLRKSVLFVIAGLLLSAVLLTRINLILTVFPILGIIIWREYFLSKDETYTKIFRSWFYISLVIIPVVLAAWGMTLYNTARFGSPTEFGIKYSIIGSDHSEVAERIRENKMTSVSYLALNTVQLAILRPFWTNEPHHITYYNRPSWLIGSYPRLVDDEFVSSIFFSSPLMLFMIYSFFVIKKYKKTTYILLPIGIFLLTAYIYGGLSMAYARRYIQDYYAFLVLLTFIGMVYSWKDYVENKKKYIHKIVIVITCLVVILTGVIAINLNCQVAFTLDMKRCVNFYNDPSTFEPLSKLIFTPESGTIHKNI